MQDSSNKVSKILFILVAAMVLSVVISNFHTFFYEKNYEFIVEAECNPTEQACFARHCGEDEECPPNGLEQYRMFALTAVDFETCSDSSCLDECSMGSINCEEIFCDESAGDTCLRVSPTMDTEENI